MNNPLVLDIHAAKEITGDDVEGVGFRIDGVLAMITYTSDEALAFYYDIDVGGHIELYTAAEGVDVDFLVLSNHGLAQVHADTTAEGVETGTMEGFAAIYVLITTIMY